jgi:hypothetical protein
MTKWKDRTRGGFEYRIDDENAGGDFPIQGSIQIGGNQKWSWTSNGLSLVGNKNPFDLVPADPETLPEFDDLKGVAPDASGGLSSEAFIKKGRDSWGADPEPVEQVRSLDEYCQTYYNEYYTAEYYISVGTIKRGIKAVLDLAGVKYREG